MNMQLQELYGLYGEADIQTKVWAAKSTGIPAANRRSFKQSRKDEAGISCEWKQTSDRRKK
jgi:hypothetical protein